MTSTRSALPTQPGRLPRDCPYVGLVPFKEIDSAFFFGRASEANLIAANLNASRLTLLYARSGVGKSSVLRAGVLPRLRELASDEDEEDAAPAGVLIAYVRDWSADPRAAITTAVAQAASEGWDLGAQAPSCIDTPELSVRWLRDVLEETGAETIYLVLDQFEEYLAYHAEDRGHHGVSSELGEILSTRGLRVNVLLSIREDGLAGLDRFKGTVPRLLDNYLRLAHLGPRAARSAIEGPLDRYNALAPPDDRVGLERGLVENLLDQVRVGRLAVGAEEPTTSGRDSEQGDIEAPVLQLVLARLWDVELAAGSHLLRAETLERLGGADTIARSHLDTVMHDLPPTQRDLAAAVFRHLVTPSGSKIALCVEDLAALTERPAAEVQDLLVALCVGTRSILRPVPPPAGTPGAMRYEIFHDVIGGAILAWRRRYVAEAERAAAERRLAAERAESERRLAAERKQAEADAQVARLKLRQARLVALALVVVMLVVLGLGGWAWRLKVEAQQSALLSRAGTDLTTSPSVSLDEAVQAHRLDPDSRSRQAILTAASAPRGRIVAGPEPRIVHMVRSADRTRVVALGDGGLVRVLGEDGRPLGPDRYTGSPAPVQNADVAPDGDHVAVVDTDGHAATLSLASGQTVDLGTFRPRTSVEFFPGSSGDLVLLNTFGGSEGVITLRTDGTTPAVALAQTFAIATPMGDGTVVTGHQDGRLRVWNARTGDRLAESPPLRGRLTFVKPDGPGQFVALTEGDAPDSIVTWDWRSGAAPVVHQLETDSRLIWSLSVDEAAGTVMLAADKTARAYRIADGAFLGRVNLQPDWVDDAVMSPDRQWVATAGADGRVLVWSMTDGTAQAPTYEFRDHDGPVTDVEWVDGSRGLMTLGSDGTVRRWDLPAAQRFTGHDWELDLDVSGDGRWLAAASQDKTVTVIRADSPAAPPVATFPGLGSMQAVRFDPTDPSRVITLGADGSAPQLWQWREGTPPVPTDFAPVDDGTPLAGLAISPDGRTVASGDSLGFVRLWDTTTGMLIEGPSRVVEGSGTTGNPVFAVALDRAVNPRDQLVAAAGPGGVTVWQRDPDGRLVARPRLPLPDATTIAFDPTGRYLAGATGGGTIQLWARDGTPLWSKPLVAGGRLGAVSFSADGRLVAAGTTDGLVEVWDAESGHFVTSTRQHAGFVNKVLLLGTDGSRVVSASDDDTVAVWPCLACRDPDAAVEEAVAAQGGG